jgi:LysM repeat protein
VDDAEKIHAELVKLRRLLEAPPPTPKSKPTSTPKEKVTADKPAGDDKVFQYTIQSGDTLSAIVQAYKEKNVKVTAAQILKANPGLKAERLIVGTKIFIPVPQP